MRCRGFVEMVGSVASGERGGGGEGVIEKEGHAGDVCQILKL